MRRSWLAALAMAWVVYAQEATPKLVVTLKPDLHHVQGIDLEGDRLWVSSVDAKAGKGYVSLLSVRTGELIRQVEVQEGRRIHAGGLQLDGESVWVPVAEYDRDGPTTVVRLHRDTLRVESRFEVADHIGCVAAGPDLLMGGNWDSKLLYVWTKEGRELGRRPNPGRTGFQDLKLLGGRLLASGNSPREGVVHEAGAIEWWDPVTWTLLRRVTVGKTDRGVPFTNEGMTWRGERLYLLPEDAPSRLFVVEK
ncbi:MAG: hypothetical protein J0L64_02615 [Acidobacteria bacterium]|nr:hypothetical protein [Acidobacteriota bacterium]